jgi:hypothetical protein
MCDEARGAWQPRPPLQTDFVNGTAECCLNIFNTQRFSSQGDEYVVIEGSIGTAVFQIVFDSCLRGLMQGYKATFAEFGTPNHQTIRGYILKAQSDCFGHTQPRACQQSEQRAVNFSPQGTVTGLRCCLHETLDIFLGASL